MKTRSAFGMALLSALVPALTGLSTALAEPLPLSAGEGTMVAIGVRHRLENTGDTTAFLVFQLSPLAPHPALGHVDTEALPGPVCA